MATLKVKNRDFQRAAGVWMQRARLGDTVVIVGSEGPPLTLRAGQPALSGRLDWAGHFAWLEGQPLLEQNPVDQLRREESR